MIPKGKGIMSTTIQIENLPTRTYEINLKNETVANFCDKLEAMRQLIYKIVNTERYQHNIYSWNYGIEINDLFGEPSSYVYPEIKRRITEALTQDERILSVGAFLFESIAKGKVQVSFTVGTVFGEVMTEREVSF